jgi:hypothetical protein
MIVRRPADLGKADHPPVSGLGAPVEAGRVKHCAVCPVIEFDSTRYV